MSIKFEKRNIQLIIYGWNFHFYEKEKERLEGKIESDFAYDTFDIIEIGWRQNLNADGIEKSRNAIA